MSNTSGNYVILALAKANPPEFPSIRKEFHGVQHIDTPEPADRGVPVTYFTPTRHVQTGTWLSRYPGKPIGDHTEDKEVAVADCLATTKSSLVLPPRTQNHVRSIILIGSVVRLRVSNNPNSDNRIQRSARKATCAKSRKIEHTTKRCGKCHNIFSIEQ